MSVSTKKATIFGSEKVRATRPLDYIYDPLYTFSGPKGYYKTAHESYKTSSECYVQPIFDSMFSDMVRYPRATLVLRPAHQPPQDIDTSYKGKVKATSQERTMVAEVTGTDRYKYFRRPVTETQATSPATTRFPLLGVENVTNLGIMAPPTTAEKLRERSHKQSSSKQTRGAQTDFRESEAQTIPWVPPYVTHGPSTPEVLRLEKLTWGEGLPPGQHEVQVVEHLRKKHAWESRLPPLDSEANIKKRFKLIADMEKSDWAFREKEIKAVHEERMKKSEQLLEQHMLLNRARLTYRMEFLEDEFEKVKQRKLASIRREKERELRKLCMKEKGYNPKYRKMSAVDEHLNHTSQLYGPMKRFGITYRNKNEKLAEKHITIDNNDLRDVENAVVYKPTFDYENASKPKKQIGLCDRETRWTIDNLAQLHIDLQALRVKDVRKGDVYFNHAFEKLVKPRRTRGKVDSVPLVQDGEERLYQAAVLIQRVIQGRAGQIKMYQARERWKEVIAELKSTEEMTNRQFEALAIYKDDKNYQSRIAGLTENEIGLNIGMSISQTLDQLATELIRLKNESTVHNQALSAECARWRREAPENGRRQKEMRRREEHNLMFTQIMEAYQEAVDDFMTSLIARAKEHEAKTEAYEHAKEVARLNALKALEEEPEVGPASADLLFEFLAPEGLRELARTCMMMLRQKYIEARQQLVKSGQAQSPSDTTETVPNAAETSERTWDSSFTSYVYSEVGPSTMDLQGSEDTSGVSRVRFGLSPPASPEDRLLARIMRDMCYMAGRLLHTAAKILNKALQLANIPQDSFEEALRRTMLVINEAREEVVRMILPKQAKGFVLPSQLASPDIVAEASAIIDAILEKAREKIKERGVIGLKKDVQFKAEHMVKDVIDEAQRKVLQTIVEDFLEDLITEARNSVEIITNQEE